MEYGDAQCPQSGQVHVTIMGMQQRLGEQLALSFRHLSNDLFSGFQGSGEYAAQGKFWEMHDILF